MSEQKIQIADVKRLNVGPDDTLVVKVAGRIPSDIAERVRRMFTDAVPSLHGKVIVIDDAITLAVIDTDEVVVA